MTQRDVFDSISPIDYRYWDKEVAKYLSENGFTGYKLMVEQALVKVLHKRGICSVEVVNEITEACRQITTKEVYLEEDRIHHDIRALVNLIQSRVNDKAKPFVHMTATSYDIVDTANVLRYRDVVKKVLLPSLLELEKVLIDFTLREAETKQIGRTHGQHAVPITFGFAMASYVSSLGGSIESLQSLAEKLPGKFSGAVGAYNASSLFFNDPEAFEAEVLVELGLKPAECSTQIVPPEALIRLFCEITIAAGVLANLANDLRQLQRTEIGEVGEEFKEAQVGSSTMPQKRNPINFENVISTWKLVLPRIITVFMDQISEHQRDLTNSASSRTYGEVIAYVVSVAKRMTRTMKKLRVDHKNLERNLTSQQGLESAEALQIILSAIGHPRAHEKVRLLTLQAQREQQEFGKVIVTDPEIQEYMTRMKPDQVVILENPSLYLGIAPAKAKKVAEDWKKKLEL